MKGKYYYLYFL